MDRTIIFTGPGRREPLTQFILMQQVLVIVVVVVLPPIKAIIWYWQMLKSIQGWKNCWGKCYKGLTNGDLSYFLCRMDWKNKLFSSMSSYFLSCLVRVWMCLWKVCGNVKTTTTSTTATTLPVLPLMEVFLGPPFFCKSMLASEIWCEPSGIYEPLGCVGVDLRLAFCSFNCPLIGAAWIVRHDKL